MCRIFDPIDEKVDYIEVHIELCKTLCILSESDCQSERLKLFARHGGVTHTLFYYYETVQLAVEFFLIIFSPVF
jgi:hypothetical protein